MQLRLRCFFSFLLLAAAVSATAQEQKDTVYKPVDIQAGLRLGVDLTRFAIKYFQPYRTDVTITADAQFKRNLYFASEVSFNNTSHTDTNYSYKGNGGSITLGIDYNLLKKREPGEKNIIYTGIRYGLAVFNYDIPSYTVHDPYFGNYTASYPRTNATAHWIELLIGIRAEIFKNFYMGWSLRDRILLNRKIATQDFPALVIPGYGKGNKSNAFDVQYTVSYFIPLYKVRTNVMEIKPKKK
ncbi:DUF6048 family protein [uncultured Chitinophaga sp.]|uniref:DUF6048 family protein n=1 Tax=uncultured Chitinophaga sp. TaxID=339340 RepID=UPI0025DC1221|nr:DUF6048 family protein [uncultured Chitinophaga sp.]